MVCIAQEGNKQGWKRDKGKEKEKTGERREERMEGEKVMWRRKVGQGKLLWNFQVNRY